VSVSIAPQRVFGHEAEAERQAQALSAFSALVNVFFISFTSLIPNLPVGLVVVIIGTLAEFQTLTLLALVGQWRRERTLRRGLGLFLASVLVYGYEIAIGLHFWFAPADTGALTNLFEVLLGAYAIGIGRAWELLGAPRSGFLSALLRVMRRQNAATPSDEPKKPGARKPD